MPYEKMTVKEVLSKINNGDMYLPAIQRKYVWNEEQISKLLDSILLGYPIGTFLFWDISGQIINEKKYSFYEFIKDYHEKYNYINAHAPSPILKERILGVLDGQQRLTSLFIALQGSLSLKLPRKHWENDSAFPKKQLYFNLLSEKEDEDDEITYEFKFLTEDEAEKSNKQLWFLAKDILTIESTAQLMLLVVNKGWVNNSLINKNIFTLWEYLVNKEIINYFKITKNSIDDVLDIFVRVNSGGTVLSKSDLLFSTIVSHWDKARDEIEELLKTINKIGEKFNFNNDFIMRTCLYISDVSITLKVETFKKDNVELIKNQWLNIKDSIIMTVKLLNEFGFNSENIISYNAIIPMIYYIFKGGILDDESKQELRKYIVVAQVKQIFGTASNSVLTATRDALRIKQEQIVDGKKVETYELKNIKFKLSQFEPINLTGDKSFRYTEKEINGLFEFEKGAYTFMILSLLYPNLKFSQQKFHQDHMHPYSSFENVKLKALGIDEGMWPQLQRDRNKLANLQLLEGGENESKNATSLIKWLEINENKANVKYLPENISYELKDFNVFVEKRKELMKEKLKEILL